MTDIDHPKMAGSGRDDSEKVDHPGESSEAGLGGATSGLRKHKRAHSRNKSISGRQDFLEEIANGEFKKVDAPVKESVAGGEAEDHDNEETSQSQSKEQDKLLPGKDETDFNVKKNGKLEKIKARWAHGIFVGVQRRSGEISVVTKEGDVKAARSVRRIVL